MLRRVVHSLITDSKCIVSVLPSTKTWTIGVPELLTSGSLSAVYQVQQAAPQQYRSLKPLTSLCIASFTRPFPAYTADRLNKPRGTSKHQNAEHNEWWVLTFARQICHSLGSIQQCLSPTRSTNCSIFLFTLLKTFGQLHIHLILFCNLIGAAKF